MVSGWDKSPGHNNDYVSQRWTRSQIVFLIAVIFVVFSMIAIIVYD